jgi:hypothetical protein
VACAGNDGACDNTSVGCGINSCAASCAGVGSGTPELDCERACDCAPC